MSADCETFRRSFSVGRYRCTWSVQLVAGKAISSQCEWEPAMPRRLSPVLMREYRQKRNRVHATLAEKLGGPAVVIDEWGSVIVYPDGREEVVTPKPAEKPAPAEKPTAPPRRYTLNTGARTITATFTEYRDRVVHSLECSKYGDYGDMPKLIAWLKPLLILVANFQPLSQPVA